MKTLDLFLPYVSPYVPGCSDPMALQAIRMALIDFCNSTDLVQRVYTYDVVAGQSAYPIATPAHMNMNRVLAVGWQGRWLTPVTPDQVPTPVILKGQTIGTDQVWTGVPQAYFQQTPSETIFHLYPIPDTTIPGGLTAKAAFAPSQDAQTFEDHLFDNWGEEIAAGAIARLLAMPGQQFSNIHGAPGYRNQFKQGIDDARRLKEQGYTQGAQRVTPRRFM